MKKSNPTDRQKKEAAVTELAPAGTNFQDYERQNQWCEREAGKTRIVNLVQWTSGGGSNDWHVAFNPNEPGMSLCGQVYQYNSSAGAREPHVIRTGTTNEISCYRCLRIIAFCRGLEAPTLKNEKDTTPQKTP